MEGGNLAIAMCGSKAIRDMDIDAIWTGSQASADAGGGDIIGGPNGKDHFPRLREGIERFFITDINNPAGSAKAQSTIPVLMDVMSGAKPGTAGMCNHLPGGSNVLYMDGHVTFVKYPNVYPLTPFLVEMMGNGQEADYLDW